jgi:LysM repeat protein
MSVHVVAPGDTLGAIAMANGISLSQFLAANPHYQANPNLIQVGAEIVIPAVDEGPPEAFSQHPIDAATQPCPDAADATPPIDPVLLEQLHVYDAEDAGRRHRCEKTGVLNIAQTEASDTVVIEYTGPNPPTQLEVWRNGVAIDTVPRDGASYAYPVTYAPGADPYASALTSALARIATRSLPPTVYSFKGLPRSVNVNVYNPDQWKLEFSLPPVRNFSVSHKHSNESQLLSDTKIEEKELILATDGSDSVATIISYHESVTQTSAHTRTVEKKCWGMPSSMHEIKQKNF